ncbi:MAG TPA: phosphoribosylamine--glycine ligase [Kofleriaceae bacterium]|jgi:phosphoribosylamine--glycine ligase|nr:phosphoribosylamine--glycine ligase [Kofleriaceae bacterium]
MKILVVGSGGREHALVWRLAKSGHAIVCAPGNPGIEPLARCVPIKVDDHAGLVELAAAEAVDLVVVGPEAPLVAGLADRLRARGLLTFGPSAAGARLEGSKAFSKDFFARHNIPTAAFRTVSTVAEADAAIAELGKVVVKADGLAAGKGVVIAADAAEARAAAHDMLEARRFGDAGATVVIEQHIVGREVSVHAFTDGTRLEILPPAEDHKTIFDGDRGPNTGGMGTVSPTWASDAVLEAIEREILQPTVAGLRADGIDYRGVLYAGVMVGTGGTPWLLEYNCRFGDPETQPIMARMVGDLGVVLAGAARGHMPVGSLAWDARASVCVVVASAGYPEAPRTGDPIGGLDALAADDDVIVFHAGTARRDGRIVSAGGRVLGVTALGVTVEHARERAYAAVDRIDLPGKQVRRDIGARGLRSL